MTDDWSLDVALRYMPVVRLVRRENSIESVLEVGSGTIGIGPYLTRTVVAADTEFSGPVDRNLLPVVARGVLPFHDKSFDLVVSLDTLEHVPRDARQYFVTELLRVSRRMIVIGFPEGKAAEAHDQAMGEYYSDHQGEAHPYCMEHMRYGIPREGEAEQYLDKASRQLKVRILTRREKNANIAMRAMVLRLLWHRKRSVQRLYSLLTSLSRLDRLFHFGVCYRSLYHVTLE